MYINTLDPTAFYLFDWPVKWYGIAYVVSMILAFKWGEKILQRYPQEFHPLTPPLFWDFLSVALIGIVLGGRLGQVLFYDLDRYIANPEDILKIWQGGMSFHGGFLGVVVAGTVYAYKHSIPVMRLADLIGVITPVGLFLGRIANFVNGELVGRPTNGTWGVVFPSHDNLLRHPSQLYEAGLEGLLLGIILYISYRFFNAFAYPGRCIGLFISGYGLFRMIGELFREPEASSGYLAFGSTWGQWLSLPLVIAGILIIQGSNRRGSSTKA